MAAIDRAVGRTANWFGREALGAEWPASGVGLQGSAAGQAHHSGMRKAHIGHGDARVNRQTSYYFQLDSGAGYLIQGGALRHKAFQDGCARTVPEKSFAAGHRRPLAERSPENICSQVDLVLR